MIAGCNPSPEDYGLACRTSELAGNKSPAFCSAAQHILVHSTCSALLLKGGVKVTHLPKTLQDFFHLLISPEKICQGFLHWVQIGQSLLLLHYELLNSVVGDRFLSLFILWKKRGVEKREVFSRVTGVSPLSSLPSTVSTVLCPICVLVSLEDPEKSDYIKTQAWSGKQLLNTVIFKYFDVGGKCECISVLMISSPWTQQFPWKGRCWISHEDALAEGKDIYAHS